MLNDGQHSRQDRSECGETNGIVRPADACGAEVRSLGLAAELPLPMNDPASHRPSGLPHAIGCYLVWGLLPLYLRLVHAVPPFEFVGWRLVFTLPVCLAIVAARRQGADVLA